MSPEFHATTVLCVRKGGVVAMGGDGQVTVGETVMKANATKVRRLADGEVLAGFAGAVADAFTLFERFEGKLKEFNRNLQRAAVELGKEWRTDKYLRQLNALLAVSNRDISLLISGSGEIIEPEDGILAIGSVGAILMPALVGAVADVYGFTGGMGAILAGMVALITLSAINYARGPRVIQPVQAPACEP